MTVPLGPMDLARRALELRETLAVKQDAWPEEILSALRSRVAEVEAAATRLRRAPTPPP